MGSYTRAMEYFNKPPRKSKPTPPHQDGYFNLDNDKAVTGWLALEDVDDEMDVSIMLKVHKHEGYRPHGKSKFIFQKGLLILVPKKTKGKVQRYVECF